MACVAVGASGLLPQLRSLPLPPRSFPCSVPVPSLIWCVPGFESSQARPCGPCSGVSLRGLLPLMSSRLKRCRPGRVPSTAGSLLRSAAWLPIRGVWPFRSVKALLPNKAGSRLPLGDRRLHRDLRLPALLSLRYRRTCAHPALACLSGFSVKS